MSPSLTVEHLAARTRPFRARLAVALNLGSIGLFGVAFVACIATLAEIA